MKYLDQLFKFKELNMEIKILKEININYIDSVYLESEIVNCPNLLKNISWCVKNICIQKFQIKCFFDEDKILMNSNFNFVYENSNAWIKVPLNNILTLI
jgi:hypothetical protein